MKSGGWHTRSATDLHVICTFCVKICQVSHMPIINHLQNHWRTSRQATLKKLLLLQSRFKPSTCKCTSSYRADPASPVSCSSREVFNGICKCSSLRMLGACSQRESDLNPDTDHFVNMDVTPFGQMETNADKPRSPLCRWQRRHTLRNCHIVM